MQINAFLFDLDGVLVDTARFHYRGWRRLAQSLGFDITPQQNEELKGVSRMDSLDRILDWGGLTRSEEEKHLLAAQKNDWYVDMISQMTPADVLPGVIDLLQELQMRQIRIGLGSASKNAPFILQCTGLDNFIEAVVDGSMVTRGKPDPEVFLAGARMLNTMPAACVVVEDAEMGLQAARRGGMFPVGIGQVEDLPSAACHFSSVASLDLDLVLLLAQTDEN